MTPIGYFMEMPIGDFFEYVKIIASEIDRENEAFENGGKNYV
jgi:hypothetical protein